MSAPETGGNVRNMTVAEWATFLNRSSSVRQKDIEEVAREAKQMVYSSKTLSGQEKDTIWRTIDRAHQMCLGDLELSFTEGPDGPKISLDPPKVEGRYTSGGVGFFIDPDTPRRLGKALLLSPIAFVVSVFLGMASSDPQDSPGLAFFTAAFVALAMSAVGSSPRLRVKGDAFGRVLVLMALATLAFLTIGKGKIFPAMLVLPFALPIADILWLEARGNFFERRVGVGMALLLISGILLVSPAMSTLFVSGA